MSLRGQKGVIAVLCHITRHLYLPVDVEDSDVMLSLKKTKKIEKSENCNKNRSETVT